MPTPLPNADLVNLEPPDQAEAQVTAIGVASAAAPAGGLTPLQRVLIEALFPAMTGFSVDVSTYRPLSAEEFGVALSRRDEQFRTRGVQLMLLCALVLRPLPEEVVERISAFARELCVDDAMIEVAQRFADGALGLAAIDFERNGYAADWSPADASVLHTHTELAAAWDVSVTDEELTAQWASLADLPGGTLGRGVWEMYLARGFVFPGTPGSAPPLLAQHDWVHVLADYGTTVDAELEVFAFIARSNDDMRAFSLLAMVVSLFETGYLRSGAGLFEASTGHLSADSHVPVRLADAMRRGARCHDHATGSDSIDFLRVDWFSVAHLPVEEVRERFSVTSKSAAAVRAGSVGPDDPGGISPFQIDAGRHLAEARGVQYDSFGASV